jgi:two-component system sensor histidine kinase HydH
MDVVTAALTGVAFLLIAGLAASRGRVEPLAARFAVLCIVLFAYVAFVLFATLSQRPEWIRDWVALANGAASMATPVFYHYVIAFLGQRRHRSASVAVCYAYFGANALLCLRPTLFPHIGPLSEGATWAVLMLIGISQFAASSVVLLFRHARRSAADERARAALVIAAVVVATCGNAADLVTLTRTIKLPAVGPWALVASALLLAAATLRFKVLARMPVLVALNVAAVGLLAALGELVLFRSLGGRSALLAAGSITIALAALGAGRYLLESFVEHRQRVLMHATLGRMSQQMAHDLRNPLGIIKGHAQALQFDLEQGHPLEPGALDPIIQHVERMARTIDDYRRIGRVEPQLRETDVNVVVTEAMNGGAFERKDLDPNLPKCMADADLLVIAIENVLRNAREAKSGGKVEVRTWRTHDAVAIAISDDGPGMDPRTRERVFDDFFTTKTTGSGLGLSYVRRVMEAHGGHVALESTVGKGTRVTLELPLRGVAD